MKARTGENEQTSGRMKAGEDKQTCARVRAGALADEQTNVNEEGKTNERP